MQINFMGLLSRLSQRNSRFDPGPANVRLAIEEVTLGPFILLVYRYSPLIIVPSMSHTLVYVNTEASNLSRYRPGQAVGVPRG
jgi:hypothetical protein